MEIFQIEVTVIIVISLTATAKSEEFKVFRTPSEGEDGWLDGRDSFLIPPSQCGSVHSKNCRHFRAEPNIPSGDKCSCLCPLSRATFLFNNRWECSDNNEVRRILGNRYSGLITFDGESSNGPLPMVNNSDSKKITLRSSLHNCKVDVGHSRSIGCYGPGVPFRNKPPFKTLLGRDKTDFPYFLQVDTLNQSNTEEFRGRIIKLSIICSSNVLRWLLLKYVGNVNCNSTAPKFPPTTKPPHVHSESGPNGAIVSVTKVSENRPTASAHPPRPGRERVTHHFPSVGLVAGLIASALLIMIVIGFSLIGQHHSNKMPQLSPKTGGTEDAATRSQRASSAYEADDENGYKALDIRELGIYGSKYQVPTHDNAKHSVNGDAHPSRPGEDNKYGYASANVSVYKDPNLDSGAPVYRDPDLDTELRGKNSGPITVEQREYNYLEDLSVSGEMRSAHDGKKKIHGHILSKRYFDQSPRPSQSGTTHNKCGNASAMVPDHRGRDVDSEESGYKDPDLDTELRGKNSGPIRVEQREYSYLEDLSVARGLGSGQDGKDKTQGHILSKRYFERSPRTSQLGTTHNENGDSSRNVSVYKAPDLDTEDSVYKDPDLDTGLRGKNNGPIRVEQREYNYLEELSVAVEKRLGQNDTHGRVLSKRYFDRSATPSQYGSMPKDGHVLDERHLHRSARPSQYGSMSKDGHVFDEHTLNRSARSSQYGTTSPDKKIYNYTLERYLPQVGNTFKGSETINESVCSVLEEEDEEESHSDGHDYDDVHGTKNDSQDPE